MSGCGTDEKVLRSREDELMVDLIHDRPLGHLPESTHAAVSREACWPVATGGLRTALFGAQRRANTLQEPQMAKTWAVNGENLGRKWPRRKKSRGLERTC